MGFLLSLHLALTTYINSSFLSSFVSEKFVGIIYILGSIASILTLLIVPKIFRAMGGYRFLLTVSLLNILSLLSLAFMKNIWGAIIVFILYFTLSILIVFSLDEILEIFSKNSSTGKVRGMYLVFGNSAWIISQLASSRILENFSFKIVYFISFIIMVVFFLVFWKGFRNIPDPKYDRSKAITYTKEFFKNKNLLRSYTMNLLLQFFFSLMVIYTPIYLYTHLGFTWSEIGIIFAIMLVPFLIIPFPVGKYSDKIGERKMLMLGFTITSLATLSLFFIEQHEVYLWALILFMTRIGASTVETMSDVYFFKHIKPENEEFVAVYRSTPPVAYIIGPMVASLVFYFVPAFNFIYLVLGAVMLYGIYLSSTIRKSDI